jgi:hypothetical protein
MTLTSYHISPELRRTEQPATDQPAKAPKPAKAKAPKPAKAKRTREVG